MWYAHILLFFSPQYLFARHLKTYTEFSHGDGAFEFSNTALMSHGFDPLGLYGSVHFITAFRQRYLVLRSSGNGGVYFGGWVCFVVSLRKHPLDILVGVVLSFVASFHFTGICGRNLELIFPGLWSYIFHLAPRYISMCCVLIPL